MIEKTDLSLLMCVGWEVVVCVCGLHWVSSDVNLLHHAISNDLHHLALPLTQLVASKLRLA